MDTVSSEQQNTYGLVFLFLLLFGPLCGLASIPLSGGIAIIGDVGAGFPEFLVVSLILGLVPGFVIGVIYALLPRRWQRIVIAPVIVLTPLLPLAIWSATIAREQGVEDLSFAVCVVGALGATGCAAIARLLGIDRRG